MNQLNSIDSEIVRTTFTGTIVNNIPELLMILFDCVLAQYKNSNHCDPATNNDHREQVQLPCSVRVMRPEKINSNNAVAASLQKSTDI